MAEWPWDTENGEALVGDVPAGLFRQDRNFEKGARQINERLQVLWERA